MADDTADRLARIEHEISKHRSLYLRATWAGHQGEAEWHETEVDKLLRLWSEVRSQGKTPAPARTGPGRGQPG